MKVETYPNKDEMSKDGFNQVCVIHQEAGEIDDIMLKEVNKFLKEVEESLEVKLKYIGFYNSRDRKYKDLFFYVHNDSIPTFSIRRFAIEEFAIRWFEDVILNDKYFYPEKTIEAFYSWDRSK